MARKDWFYPNIPTEMGVELDKIVTEAGAKYGISNKTTLINNILASFISRYEETKNLMPSIRDVDATPKIPPNTRQEKLDSVARLLDIMNKHAEENDCRHTFKQILKEWYPEWQKNNG